METLTIQPANIPAAVTKNEVAIANFFDSFDKPTYQELLREMFDSYVISWRFTQLSREMDRANAIGCYRELEKFIESININREFLIL